MLTEEQRKTVEKNHNLIYQFIYDHQLSIDEYYDILAISLCKSVEKYDESRNASFTTFTYTVMINDVRMHIRRSKNATRIPKELLLYYQDKINDDNDEEFLDIMPDDINIEEEVIFKILYESIRLNDKEKQIINLLINGYTQVEISKIIGVGQPRISKLRKKISEQFKTLKD